MVSLFLLYVVDSSEGSLEANSKHPNGGGTTPSQPVAGMAVQGVLVSLCEFTKEEPEDANETDMCGFVWKSEEPIRLLAATFGSNMMVRSWMDKSQKCATGERAAMLGGSVMARSWTGTNRRSLQQAKGPQCSAAA
jgi:hypothetical protein